MHERVLKRWRLAAVVATAALVAATVPTVAGASVEAQKKKKRGTIGYVVAGDRNDGGFYQGQVESVTKTAKKLGYKVIVVDKVNPGAAQEAFANLCRQGPDLIIGGGSELTDGFIPVSESPECEKITFILVAGFPPPSDSLATVGANENEAHYMGGVAAGLLLNENGGDAACVVGGPDLPFVRSMEANMTAGLASVAPDKEMLVTLTGDFEDAALATEALTALIERGCTVFYPYLGGALPAANDLATQRGIGIISTSVNLCGVPADAIGGWNIVESILYNPALFLPTMLKKYSQGKIKEGKQLALYGVGDSKKLGFKDANDGPGAVICEATPEQQTQLDDVRAGIVSGDIQVENVGG
jgi:basic membrane lipoprotein Med (substrate-binding protein (PBP1-ABC) superfamily)